MEILKLERIKNAVQREKCMKLTFFSPAVSALWKTYFDGVRESPDCIYGRV